MKIIIGLRWSVFMEKRTAISKYFKRKCLLFRTILFFAVIFCWISSGQTQGPEKVIHEGKKLFEDICADCHRITGQGLPEKFPALDKNSLVVEDPNKVIDTVLNGRKGKLGQMPSWKESFKDEQIAAIITYIRQAWSNKATAITADMVKKRRK
jgi:mono/diheme cytochrome c family protein